MSIKLYEITETYRQALDHLTDPENSFDPKTVADTLESIQIEFEAKAVNVAAYIRQMEAETKAIKAEEERMEKRRKSLEARAKGLKDYIKQNMEAAGLKKISHTWLDISIQKKPASVDVFDESKIPDEYKAIEYKIDKTAIKDALSAGREVAGAKLANGTRLSIR